MTLATLSGLASGELHPDTRGAPNEMLRAYKEKRIVYNALYSQTTPSLLDIPWKP
jgi:hypothetical protein